MGEHIGSTESKTVKKIQEAEGGILFVDEAYQLQRERSKVDFGIEAVGVIMKHLNHEPSRCRTIFILAGYENEIYVHEQRSL